MWLWETGNDCRKELKWEELTWWDRRQRRYFFIQDAVQFKVRKSVWESSFVPFTIDRKWICVFVSILLTSGFVLSTEDVVREDVVREEDPVQEGELQNDVEIEVGLWDPEVSNDPLNIDQADGTTLDVSESILSARSYGVRPVKGYVSPYQTAPGTYTRESYGGPRYPAQGYNRHSIYADYLGSPSYASYSKQCLRSYGQTPRLTSQNLRDAFNYATYSMQQYTASERQSYSSGNYLNATMYSSAARQQVGVYRPSSAPVSPVYQKEKEALFNEYASKFLMKK